MNTKELLQELMSNYQETVALFKKGGKEMLKDPEVAAMYSKLQEMKPEVEALVQTYKSSKTTTETAIASSETGAASNKTTTPPVAKKINASVGTGGNNQKEDVKLVQQLLNAQDKAGLVEDGGCGPKTIAAIKAFQQKKLGFADGRIDPDGKTWKLLLGNTQPIVIEEPVIPDPKEVPTTETGSSDAYSLSASVGKAGENKKNDVILVQALLARHGAKIGVDGDCGGKTITAIENFQQEKIGSKTGLIAPGSPTLKALLEKPANLPAGQEEIATGMGASGKLGNSITKSGAYVVSVPPNASGALPLLLLFSGLNQDASSLLAEVPDVYYLKAIMVFSAHQGSFSGAQGVFQPILTAKALTVASVSICGFSLGGQAAFRNYSHATKAVGLMDPTTYYGDLKKIDGKAVFVAKTKNGKALAYGWDWSGNKPGDPKYTCQQARADGIDTAKTKGGVGEEASMEHGKFPKYVLSKYKSKFI